MSESPKLLLVDDDESLRNSFRSDLEDRWEIAEAGTLKTAKEAAEWFHPDAILLDLNLPCSQGFPTWTTMQMLCPNVPIVVLTEYENEVTDLINAGIKKQYIIIKDGMPANEVTRIVLTAIKELEAFHIYAGTRAKLHDSDIAIQEMKVLNTETPVNCKWDKETKSYPRYETPPNKKIDPDAPFIEDD